MTLMHKEFDEFSGLKKIQRGLGFELLLD